MIQNALRPLRWGRGRQVFSLGSDGIVGFGTEGIFSLGSGGGFSLYPGGISNSEGWGSAVDVGLQ